MVIIEGHVKNMPDGKIYLTEAHHWDTPLDSTISLNGDFVFKIKADSSFVPYMAAIHFPDSSKSTKVGSLFLQNYMFKSDSRKYGMDAFYLERGFTRIEGEYEKKPYPRVFAGKETDVMYKNVFTDFGWIGNIDSTKRIQRINFFQNEIKKYPFSYFLLQSIYNAKEQYSEEEISKILGLFNSDVQKSKLGDQFRSYLKNRTDFGKPYPNLMLLTSSNERQNIIDTNFKLTMLVFWASWCGPCRKEIPLLKEIRNKYKGKALNLVSISIDDDKNKWTKALSEEKMNWTQYIVDDDKIDMIKQQFNFSVIPLVVFTDKTGKEIKKFIGYDKEQKNNYEMVIDNFFYSK
ncbi:thioredoxin-like domain-containing protein [Parafilimonas sp.]|uniref:thioredoxin-like domain-containing protein n=1 Tax=Parafilimonas sp. TaxID=1969739 RepID=UPI0039E4D15E